MQNTQFIKQKGVSDRAETIALPPLIYGVAFVVGLLLQAAVPIQVLPHQAALWLGILFILVSIVIVVSAVRALARSNTTFDSRKPTTAIATDGAFRYSRNPMYLSVTLLYLGVALLINSLLMLLLILPLTVIMQWGVIEREEKYLEQKFGDEYRHYKARVRQWI